MAGLYEKITEIESYVEETAKKFSSQGNRIYEKEMSRALKSVHSKAQKSIRKHSYIDGILEDILNGTYSIMDLVDEVIEFYEKPKNFDNEEYFLDTLDIVEWLEDNTCYQQLWDTMSPFIKTGNNENKYLKFQSLSPLNQDEFDEYGNQSIDEYNQILDLRLNVLGMAAKMLHKRIERYGKEIEDFPLEENRISGLPKKKIKEVVNGVIRDSSSDYVRKWILKNSKS